MTADDLEFLNAVEMSTTFASRSKSSYCPFHSHPYVELVYHLQGSGSTTTRDGLTFNYPQGSIVIYAQDVFHDQQPDSSFTDICVHFEIDRQFWSIHGEAVFFEVLPHDWMKPMLVDLSNSTINDDPWTRALNNHRLQALLIALFSEAHSQNSGGKDLETHLVQRARNHISQNFHAIKSLPDLASHLECDYHHLRYQFKRHEKVSLKEYLITCRLNHAKHLLTHANIPIKAIATQCGFETERFFCTTFRKREDKTPGQFREIHSSYLRG